MKTENESYFTYDAGFPSVDTRFVLDYTGQLKQFVWGEDFTEWAMYWTRPTLQCEVHGFCGAFGSCSTTKEPLCECLKGSEPTVLKDWELEDHSGECVRKTPLQCWNDTFFVISNMVFPVDAEKLTVTKPEECEKARLSNCSCTLMIMGVWSGKELSLIYRKSWLIRRVEKISMCELQRLSWWKLEKTPLHGFSLEQLEGSFWSWPLFSLFSLFSTGDRGKQWVQFRQVSIIWCFLSTKIYRLQQRTSQKNLEKEDVVRFSKARCPINQP